MAGILSSLACVINDISEHAETFHNPGELWEVMKRSLRQLFVDADAEAVCGLAILLADDFPSLAVRCIKSWMMRGVYSPLLQQQVVELVFTWARLAQPISRRRPDSATALAENSPDVLDLVRIGIRPAGQLVTNERSSTGIQRTPIAFGDEGPGPNGDYVNGLHRLKGEASGGDEHHLRCQPQQGLQRGRRQKLGIDAVSLEQRRMRFAGPPVRVRDGPVHEQGDVLDGQHGPNVMLVAVWPAEAAELAVILAVGHDLHGKLARDLVPLRKADLWLQARRVATRRGRRTLARSCTGCWRRRCRCS